MKPKFLSICCLLLLISVSGIAQTTYSISGKIKSAKGAPLEAATIFLAGSQRATITNAEGEFTLNNIEVGTYDLMVSMIGYAPIKRNLIVRDAPVTFDTVMQVKPVMLAQVNIGRKVDRESYLKTFIKYFMGESANAKACKIMNPNIIEFSTNKSELKAYTEDFLIIENPKLGYRVKYLLRNFSYDRLRDATFYEGESVFEELPGTPEQQKTWVTNRLLAYNGSMMHYLRALYADNTRDQGFLTYQMLNTLPPIEVTPNPINTEQLISRTDSNFMQFRYKHRLYVLYDKKKAAADKKPSTKESETMKLDDKGSIFMMDGEVDKRGSIAQQKALLIQNFWGKKRIGDQLPIEYVPPAADPGSK
ncbi:carboxypeptidase-like regulatory domain-containing protein [Mucilaginibacter myungsuensis]|uniref:Carboxypeptidase-like regulatory domain-containing protein n=1 Tax=Mucilaginibacter myungsuensis TaxID=649104 RepID=A0A929KWX6_9SPHI|nr:carboxypeptidase-like regulatory domain-containing protein [Mucilaginibacter myungsuensis]MBE9661963.1 carboxypeptidase-like regulatory domain-containing protein [Mucilaginibacter myungsuensis]MDN3599604.1 carboxypeptidase-like regulatory domain-containing protein [Mucilaginibacter myungsuensis]